MHPDARNILISRAYHVEVLPGQVFLPLSLNLSTCVTRVGCLLPLLYYSESQKRGFILPEEVLQHLAETDVTSENLYTYYRRTLVHEWDLQPGNAAFLWSYISSHEKGENVQASVCEQGVSSRAWVLFLYSIRNKTLRGFFKRARWSLAMWAREFFLVCPHYNLYTTKVWGKLQVQINNNYNYKAWEHLVSASERRII